MPLCILSSTVTALSAQWNGAEKLTSLWKMPEELQSMWSFQGGFYWAWFQACLWGGDLCWMSSSRAVVEMSFWCCATCAWMCVNGWLSFTHPSPVCPMILNVLVSLQTLDASLGDDVKCGLCQVKVFLCPQFASHLFSVCVSRPFRYTHTFLITFFSYISPSLLPVVWIGAFFCLD